MPLHVNPSFTVIADDAANELAARFAQLNNHLPRPAFMRSGALTVAKQRFAEVATPALIGLVLTASQLLTASGAEPPVNAEEKLR